MKLLIQKEMVFGLPKVKNLDFCESCVYGKLSKKVFPVGKSRRASVRVELVHADLCGPMSVESSGGSRYFLLFTDYYTRISWIYFLKLKSERFDNFKKFNLLLRGKVDVDSKLFGQIEVVSLCQKNYVPFVSKMEYTEISQHLLHRSRTV